MTLREIIGRNYDASAIFITKTPDLEEIEHFKKLPPEQQLRFRVIEGHFEFGLHSHLPEASTYITMLRNPVDRAISYYYYVLKNRQHYLHKKVTSVQMTFRSFIASKLSKELNNGQVRLLVKDGMQPNFGECTRDMLEAAKQNLQNHFAVVGLTEQFDESVVLMRRALGWKMPVYLKRNVTPHHETREALPQDLVSEIERDNVLDIELYQFASLLMKQAIERQPRSFRREVRRLQITNSFYSASARISRGPRQLARTLIDNLRHFRN